MRKRSVAVFFGIASVVSSIGVAAVSPEEAKQLGGPALTEWGAERAGNKDGSIPAFTDEKVKAPASYDPKDPLRVPDPFGEKPLYSITSQNMDKYADKLTAGQKAMLKLYPAYRMDIYPTHRIVHYTKAVNDSTLKNATSCRSVRGGVRIEGCYGGVPFPIPKTGNEAVWNLQLANASPWLNQMSQAIFVDVNGKSINQGQNDAFWYAQFWDQSIPGQRSPSSAFAKIRWDTLNPPRRMGEKYSLSWSLDPADPGLRAYAYIPGQRRVKLAPDLAYDTPSPVAGGSSTMDESQVFSGAQDRYDFKLVGKRETYLVANSNFKADYKACPIDTFVKKNFINPECVRFELRRTWVVELQIKPGFRHILPKRTLYIDEDWSGAAAGDSYDASGKLYRAEYNPTFVYYDSRPNFQESIWHDSYVFDLQNGTYSIAGYTAFPGGGFTFIKPKPQTFFSPEALAAEGIR